MHGLPRVAADALPGRRTGSPDKPFTAQSGGTHIFRVRGSTPHRINRKDKTMQTIIDAWFVQGMIKATSD
ncbi:rhamnulose-1-phosphate aldolase, partial [Acinetobacter baumannii]|nr:rhamnulose-1-phosphate aldolase [Acinetobacter baumannii]